MKLINAFLAKLTSLMQRLFPKKDDIALGVNAIVQRFKLLEEGKKLGLLGLPPFHSKELSSIELEVVRYIEHQREKIKHDFISNIEQIDAEISETKTHQHDLFRHGGCSPEYSPRHRTALP